MNFLTDESPGRVFLMASGAVMSLALLFTLTVTDSSLASVEVAAVIPVNSAVASLRSVPEAAAEAVYATAVYVGVIPESQSVYAAVDFPPQSYLTSASGQIAQSGARRVAGASIVNDPEVAFLQDPDSMQVLTPMDLLKFFMGR